MPTHWQPTSRPLVRHCSFASLLLVFSSLLVLFMPCSAQSRSSKRGLIYITRNANPSDNGVWTSAANNGALTWYYNYSPSPSSLFASISSFQFVPMLFGAPVGGAGNTSFLNTVTSQIESGANISAVLTFNEPDGSTSTGGSPLAADVAAQIWQTNIEPLHKRGVKLGAPAVTGSPTGFVWLQSFFNACAGNCSVDFIPVHFYGNFEGLASHVGQVRGTYGNASIWVTEYADPNANLQDSQSFYNQSASFLDRVAYVDRYSYFGSFRSSVSNIGPDAAFLTQSGQLTDIGSWYFGGSATGAVPNLGLQIPALRSWTLCSVVGLMMYLA